MVIYPFWAIWNKPPVILNKLETEESDIQSCFSSTVSHITRLPWKEGYFHRTNSGLTQAVVLSKGDHNSTWQLLHLLLWWEMSPHLPHLLLLHPARGWCFPRGGNLTLRIITHSCVERLSKKTNNAFIRQTQSKGTWIFEEFYSFQDYLSPHAQKKVSLISMS